MLIALLALSTPLLDGVTEIGAPGIPGPLVVYGEQAQVVIAGKQGKGLEPVVATATFGQGRVVAFGHGGYFGSGTMSAGQTRRLLLNAAAWSRQRPGPVGVHRAGDMAALLRAEGIDAENVDDAALANLDKYSLVVMDPANGAARHAEAIRRYVHGGGGLMIAGLGWGWLQLNPGKGLDEHPCNVIAQGMGIAWADGYLDENSPAGYSASAAPKNVHAYTALQSLRAKNADATVGQTLARAIATLGQGHDFVRQIESVLPSGAAAAPSESAPIRPGDVAKRLRMSLDLVHLRAAAPEAIAAHPAAAGFPGSVPASAATVTRTLSIDLGQPRWHGTGLYAIPGKPIKVSSQDAPDRGLRIRIGAHSDTLWHHDDWKRAPEIAVSVPFRSGERSVVNAFGGLVYIEVPQGAAGTCEIRIEGAVPAPRYVHGQTSLADWRTIRSHPAPWADIESSKIILTVPAEHIRSLDDPSALMDFWDKVADACADLATIPRERRSAERYVADVQISAGYMHAGYPIMTHLDAAPRMVDLAYLSDKNRGGDWGMFHEIGHNHQHPDWTFGGTGEVTVNLFTLYIIETVVGRVPGYHVRWTDQQILETFRKHREAGAPFDKWRSDPFLALTMYVQLQQAFGWDSFKRVFAEYRGLPQNARPKNDGEKRDQWMQRFSRTVGKNLGPFFDAWGVPVSQAAKDSLRDLPVWEFPR